MKMKGLGRGEQTWHILGHFSGNPAEKTEEYYETTEHLMKGYLALRGVAKVRRNCSELRNSVPLTEHERSRALYTC
jgi:hypothetical protein